MPARPLRQSPRRAARWLPIAGLALLAAAGSGACSNEVRARLRTRTYPPDFRYIPEQRLQSAMWQLAARVAELDRLMRDPAPGDAARRAEVIRLLEEMERATRALGPGGWPSNHPMVSQHVETFRRDLRLARQAVEREPPVYFLAGSVSGSCMHCHDAS